MTDRVVVVNPPKSSALPSAVEVVIAALALAALANVAAVIAAGGYDFRVLGVRVKASSVDRPVIIASVLFLLRWLISLGRTGLVASIKGLFPWGPVAGAAGLALFLAVVRSGPAPVSPAHGVVAGILLVVFLLAWLSYSGAYPRAARAVAFVLYLAFAWALAETTADQKAWGKSLTFRAQSGASVDTIPADTDGLLLASQAGVRLYKANVSDDWRDAAEVSPGGFFSVKANIPSNSSLALSVSVKGASGNADVAVTALVGDAKTAIWQGNLSVSDAGKWRDVRVPLVVSGDAEIIFEANGDTTSPAILFANPRIEPRPKKGPNVVFVIADALRRDRLGVYGYARATSPEIDALAAEAAVFDNCVTQAPWPPPSVGTFFTGLYASAHGMQTRSDGLSPSLDTLAGQLRKAGYYTGAIQGNPIMSPEVGVAKGFNEYFHPGARVLTAADKGKYTSAEAITDSAIAWIDANSGSPFFLYTQYMDSHTPYAPNLKYPSFGDDVSSQYDTEVRHFSAEFGRLMAHLKAKSLGDAVVVLTADHGEQFMEHGMVEHGGGLYPEELNVPLIIWAPGRIAPGRVNALVGTIDLAPTMLELAGAPALPAAEGLSLVTAAAEKELPDRKLFSELVTFRPPGQRVVSVIEGAYRFVLWNPGKGRWQRVEYLFDMRLDKGEYVNLAASNGDLVARLRKEIETHVDAQEALYRKLVPVESRPPISDERMQKLKALGYVGGGPGNN
jgi:arylsulfatase A-like enzyme